ncbi:MAG: phosphohydrolase, partial [Gammaproteobacteria bacterium]|nr:phosphohydrolase [Gammaproteobacteria bacterium]
MLMRAGHDEETIVCGLFHDVGYVTCPDTHGQFAAALLAPYVGERNRWTLHHHGVFINHHAVSHPGIDRDA